MLQQHVTILGNGVHFIHGLGLRRVLHLPLAIVVESDYLKSIFHVIDEVGYSRSLLVLGIAFP